MKNDFKQFGNDLIDAIDPDEENYFSSILKSTVNSYSSEPQFVLDIGCGNGKFVSSIKTFSNVKLVGVDGSDYALKLAKSAGYDETLLIEDFNSSSILFPQNDWDLIICKDVLEHILYPEDFVKHIVRLMKPECKLLIQVPNHFNFIGLLKFIKTRNLDVFNYFPNNNSWNNPHIRYFKFDEFISYFESLGLTVEANFCSKFSRFGPIKYILPSKLRTILATNYPMNFSEAFTILFKFQT